ncbi:MAG: rhamnogalacturonan acetylesterase [Paludibacter sp.]
MNTHKLSLIISALLSIVLSVSAQNVEKKTEQTTTSKITGEDLLGIKSGADPTKALRGKSPGNSRKKGRPVVFTIGDSTMKNGQDNGSNKQWGWGHFFGNYFDTTKVSVENHALGGRSSRTFISEGLWDKVLKAVQPGDYVFIQFGHNDSGPYNTGRARASLPGNGDKDTTVIMESTGKQETINSFGWYMRKYARDVKAKKATPILLSHIPRNMFTTKDSVAVIRNTKGFGAWTEEAAKMEKVPYINANKFIANKLDKMGKDSIQGLYYGDHTHTSLAGAQLNAKTIAEAVKASKDRKLAKLKKAVK